MYIVYTSDQCATSGSLVRPLCHPLQLQVGSSGLWQQPTTVHRAVLQQSAGIINDVPLHWRWLMIFTLTVGHAVPRHAGGAQGTLAAARVPAHIVTHTGGTVVAAQDYSRNHPISSKNYRGLFQSLNQKKSVSNTYNLLLNILALTISHQKLTFIAASNYTLLSQNEKRPLVFGWNLGILIIVYTSERKIERQREDCQKVAHHC